MDDKEVETQTTLHPTHSEKTLRAMKAEYTVKCITFNPSEAKPGETLYIHVLNLNRNEVIVPGSLVLRFNIDLTGGHANNFIAQNVSRVLVDRFSVKYVGTTLQDTLATTLTKVSRIFSFHTTCAITTFCWQVFKPRNFVKFVRTRGDKEKELKELWTLFFVRTTASGWTTRFWTISFLATGSLQHDHGRFVTGWGEYGNQIKEEEPFVLKIFCKASSHPPRYLKLFIDFISPPFFAFMVVTPPWLKCFTSVFLELRCNPICTASSFTDANISWAWCISSVVLVSSAKSVSVMTTGWWWWLLLRSSQKLNIPLFRTASGQRTFYYRTVKLWHNLESFLKLSPSPFWQIWLLAVRWNCHFVTNSQISNRKLI